eukprot:s220_g28.t1
MLRHHMTVVMPSDAMHLAPRHTIPMVSVLRVRCRCTLDPNSVCETHPCKCPECRAAKGGPGLTCKWRSLHTEYLMKNLSHVELPNEVEKVTYCEALEMSGIKAPSSPRERNLLNIMSYHSDSMASSLLVLDKSQAINRTQMWLLDETSDTQCLIWVGEESEETSGDPEPILVVEIEPEGEGPLENTSASEPSGSSSPKRVWTASDEGKLPEPLGSKCPIRPVNELKDLIGKKTQERAVGVWQTRRIETVLMKWDGVPGNLGHIIPTLKVNSDMWTSDTEIKDLQRLNGDSELAAALLIAYWFRNDSDICHWLKRELADIVLEFFSYGIGSQFDLAKNLGTCQRYTNMGRKLKELPAVMGALNTMSHRFGRDSPLDGITNLRSLFSLGLSSDDMVFVIQTLMKASGIRKSLGPVRTGTIRFDVTKVLKAILVRRDYMVHLRNQFPNMASYMNDHGTLAWYTRTFGLNALGEKDGQRVEENQDEEENEQEQQTQASSFMSMKPLENVNEARITHADGMEVIKSTVQDKADYEIELDKYLKASAENETQQIKEYIMSRIAFVIDDLTDDLPSKIAKQGLSKESKRKMLDGPVAWQQIKARRLNPFGGSGPGVSKIRIERAEIRRAERDTELQDKSLLIMTCKVDTLKSKSALDIVKAELGKLTGAKKHAMTVATIESNPTDSLQRFKRGRRAFGSKIEDRFVACSVSAISSAHCGAMQFPEGGDTYFTKWPVRLIPVADLKQMEEVAYEKLYDFRWHLPWW